MDGPQPRHYREQPGYDVPHYPVYRVTDGPRANSFARDVSTALIRYACLSICGEDGGAGVTLALRTLITEDPTQGIRIPVESS